MTWDVIKDTGSRQTDKDSDRLTMVAHRTRSNDVASGTVQSGSPKGATPSVAGFTLRGYSVSTAAGGRASPIVERTSCGNGWSTNDG